MAQQKWEYGQVYIPHPEIFGGMPKSGLDLSRINKAGHEGWELVSSVPFTTSQGEIKGSFYLFKRALD
jgi:hypothetical protein